MEAVPTWGVELSSYALRAVKLEPGEGGRPRIVAWDIVDFTEEVDDLKDLARLHTMARGLYHFRSRHQLAHSRVFVSLRGETAFNRTVVIPPVNDESLDKLLEYEAQQQIPFPLEEMFWDRRVLAIREDGAIHATLYAVRRSMVEDRLRRLAKSRFPVDGIQLRPIALHNFCAQERHLEPGTIVIGVDYGTLQILVQHDETSWFRCLPVGGVDFVTLIQKEFKVDHRRAVRLAAGEARIADKDRYLACRKAAADAIAAQASRVVSYYVAARPELRPQGVVLFSSHRCVPPLASAIKEHLKQPVIRPKGFRQIDVHPDVVTAGIQEHFPAMTTAAGLALQGIGKAEIDARLYPQDLQRQLYGGRRGFAVAAVLLILLLAFVGIRRRMAADDIDGRAGELKHSVVEVCSTLDEVREKFRTKRAEDGLRALAAPGDRRAADLPLVEKLCSLLAAQSGRLGEVCLVSLAFGDGSGLEGRRASVILAAQDAAGTDPAAAMKSVLEALEGSGLITGYDARDASWVAGSPVARKPARAAERPLRIRLVHQRFLLELGGSS